VGGLVHRHEPDEVPLPVANQAAAFERISRSSLSARFSRCNRDSSLRSARSIRHCPCQHRASTAEPTTRSSAPSVRRPDPRPTSNSKRNDQDYVRSHWMCDDRFKAAQQQLLANLDTCLDLRPRLVDRLCELGFNWPSRGCFSCCHPVASLVSPSDHA
jgi:hypothetical protein